MANHTVKPNDKIQKVLDNAAPGDTITFTPGTYKNLKVNVKTEKLTLSGDKAKLTGNSAIKLNAHGVTVEGFTLAGRGLIDCSIDKVKNKKTMGKNAVIRNNRFVDDFSGTYAKRIKVASSSDHEAIKMNPLIEGNEFINIKGGNNKKKIGGELISVKASGATIRNNTFKNVAGRISLRGGENSVVEGNTMTIMKTDMQKKNDKGGKKLKVGISGIQVYGSNNKVLKNQLNDDSAWIILGAGEANTKPSKQPFGDHLPANNAVVEGNKGGTIVLNYNFGGKGKKRKSRDTGKTREPIYTFKATGVKIEDNDSKLVDRAKGNKKKKK